MKNISITIFLVSFCIFVINAQSNCEKVFDTAMQEFDKESSTKKYTSEKLIQVFLDKNEKLKTKYPDCFSDENVTLKLDQKNMTKEQTYKVNLKYTLASESCKKELKESGKSLNSEDGQRTMSDCVKKKMEAK